MISGSVIRKAMVDRRRIDLVQSSPLWRDRGVAAVLHADVGRRLIGLRIGEPHVTQHKRSRSSFHYAFKGSQPPEAITSARGGTARMRYRRPSLVSLLSWQGGQGCLTSNASIPLTSLMVIRSPLIWPVKVTADPWQLSSLS